MGEDVLLNTWIVQAQANITDTGKLQRGNRRHQVQTENQQHRQGRRAAGCVTAAHRLFTDAQADIPAPENEDRQRQTRSKRRERLNAKGVEPVQIELQWRGLCR
ncbi:hypothetical protein D3C77_194450 [compost metagenome]